VTLSGIFDFTNNNNNNNGDNEKERRREEDEMAYEAPMSPETGDQQFSGACSVTSDLPLTPDSSPRDSNLSLVEDSYKMETSTPLKHDSGDVDADSAHLALCQSADLTDRGSERSSAASDYNTPSNPCFPEATVVYQQYHASLKTPPFLSTSMSSPVKGVAGLGSGMRCPPVREAVDPAKYITISGEPDGVKYACSKCGNIYKWRKSLNKHWKEKHDGEAPDPAAVSAAANRYVRLPTPVAAKRPSPAAFTGASSATRPTGVRGSLAAILPPLPSKSGGSLGLRHSPVNGRGWSQSESIVQLKTPTFADYKTSSNVSASPFSVLAVDSVTSKERPVDLSGSTSRTQTNDDGLDYGGMVLDLSKKGVAPYVSQSSSVQDEPIDFSTKAASSSVRNPTYDSGFFQGTFADRPLELAHAGHIAVTSLNCAQCRQKFTVPSKLNRHFADAHSDMLHATAAAVAGDASEASCGGSTQLYRYLTTEHSATREAMRCVVCGTAFSRRSAAAKHFDQEHVGLYPNPYQLSARVPSGSNGNAGSSEQRRRTGVDQQLPGTGNQLRCGRCPFTTDSFSVLARHHLRHSPRRPNDLMTSEMSRIIWSGTGGGAVDADDVKVAQLLSGTAVNMDDVIGENTAIVIPQAPEETLPTVVASCSTSSKPFKQTSSGARSSGGRGKRSDAGGSSTASAETLLPFKCELCEYRARWPSEMTQHAKNHSDEKPYHCPQCTYRSKWKWDVVKHLKRCGGGGTAHDVIDTTLLSSTSSSASVTTVVTTAASQTARRRRTSVRSLLIDVPPANTGTPSSYERGLGSVTENSTQPSAATSALSSSTASSREHLTNGPPNATVCPSIQDTASERTAAHEAVHMVANTVTTTVQAKSVESALPTPPVVSLVNQGLHYCLQCSFVGHSPAELRRHLRVHSDEKPYSCRTCCYSSKWKCDLKKHLRAYNHVSAVPLAYGGHGRKPTSDWQTEKDGLDVAADDELSGPVDNSDDITGNASAMPDSGNQPGAASLLKSNARDGVLTKTQRMPNGSNFAGITVGGRLRCRRCDFEAIDLTSFLHHKSSHASVRKDDNGKTGVQQGFQTAAAAATRPSHHRRKSSKQVRVPPQSKTDKYVNETAPFGDHGVNIDCTKLPNDDQENVPDVVDGSKFWISLGLRSKNGVSGVQSAEPADVKGSLVMDMTGDSDQKEQHATVTESSLNTAPRSSQSPYDAGDHEMAEEAADAMTASPEASSSDTDVEYVDMDQPVDLCRRRASSSVDDDAVAKPDAEILAKPVVSQSAQRVTTTEADDSAGMSKRKRKLRTCDKCGYVTDNLTTLQRHAAKHGSTGT